MKIISAIFIKKLAGLKKIVTFYLLFYKYRGAYEL